MNLSIKTIALTMLTSLFLIILVFISWAVQVIGFQEKVNLKKNRLYEIGTSLNILQTAVHGTFTTDASYHHRVFNAGPSLLVTAENLSRSLEYTSLAALIVETGETLSLWQSIYEIRQAADRNFYMRAQLLLSISRSLDEVARLTQEISEQYHETHMFNIKVSTAGAGIVFLVFGLMISCFYLAIVRPLTRLKTGIQNESDHPGQISGHLVAKEVVDLAASLYHRLEALEASRKKLDRSQSLLKTAERISRTGGWEWDVTRQEMFWTRGTFDIHGFDPQSLEKDPAQSITKSIECYAEEDRPNIRQAFQECVEKGIPYDLECRFTAANGEKIWIQTSAAAVKKNGKVVKVQGNIQDITERKKRELAYDRLQDQFIQAQKMEAVGRLAGGVAHDYNNMLGVIIGYADLALEKAHAGMPLHEDLKEILTAAERSRDITRQLLAFARKQTIEPKALDINDTVDRMLKMLKRLIGEDIDLAWLPGKDLWPVKIDPVQVDQVFANLCVNARDAIDGVGKITIETKNVVFDEEYCARHLDFFPGEFVMMGVSDDGHGMDKETLQHIFEPFFTTKTSGKGTGLGLATVYGIVKQNNGFINVYSEPEKGTTLKLYLPRHGKAEPLFLPGKPLEILPGRGETVLLVEDEALIVKLTRELLETLGYQVLTAQTPEKAIDIAQKEKERIELLITDVVMPQMNGRQLADQIKKIIPDLRVLYMSGYTANVIAHRGVLDKGVHFIPKPFSRQELAAKIRQTLNSPITDQPKEP